MAAIKLRVTELCAGRYGMVLTCDTHPDLQWWFDSPTWEPGDWETALTIAYGHAAWAHAA